MCRERRRLTSPARDFRLLLDRAYPRRSALTLVGDRYNLDFGERDILHRGVFAREDCRRKGRKVSVSSLPQYPLAVDGHNVLITVESALKGLPLVLADDGFVRDIARGARGYAPTPLTTEALGLVFRSLALHPPVDTLFLFDSAVSRSGELAAMVRGFIAQHNLRGTAQAVPVPEKVFAVFAGVIATSDSAIIADSERVFDLAGHIVRYRLHRRDVIRLR